MSSIRKVLVLGVLLGLIWGGLSGLAAAAPPDRATSPDLFEVTSRSFVIMDAKTGKILLAHNPHALYPPASTLKVMTALYVVEALKMDDKVPVSSYAAAAPPSKIYIRAGEVYTVRELLYALLLTSANDGARALAERVSGTEEAFGRQVTRKVREWGAYRTNVVNANGLTADAQYSCAQDLAGALRRAMSNPESGQIMTTEYQRIRGDRELRNHNPLSFRPRPMAVAGNRLHPGLRHTYVGMFRHGDHRSHDHRPDGQRQAWPTSALADRERLALSGSPSLRLEPLEERLRFQKRHMGKYAQAGAAHEKAKVSAGKTRKLWWLLSRQEEGGQQNGSPRSRIEGPGEEKPPPWPGKVCQRGEKPAHPATLSGLHHPAR